MRLKITSGLLLISAGNGDALSGPEIPDNPLISSAGLPVFVGVTTRRTHGAAEVHVVWLADRPFPSIAGNAVVAEFSVLANGSGLDVATLDGSDHLPIEQAVGTIRLRVIHTITGDEDSYLIQARRQPTADLLWGYASGGPVSWSRDGPGIRLYVPGRFFAIGGRRSELLEGPPVPLTDDLISSITFPTYMSVLTRSNTVTVEAFWLADEHFPPIDNAAAVAEFSVQAPPSGLSLSAVNGADELELPEATGPVRLRVIAERGPAESFKIYVRAQQLAAFARIA